MKEGVSSHNLRIPSKRSSFIPIVQPHLNPKKKPFRVQDEVWPAAAAYASLWRSSWRMRKMEESRKRSTQFERQDSSEREKRVEGVPVIHLSRQRTKTCQIRIEWKREKRNLSQHWEVKLWTAAWTRAPACSRSMNCWISFCFLIVSLLSVWVVDSLPV